MVRTLVWIGVNEIQRTAIGFLNPGSGCGLVHTYIHMYTDQEEIAFCNEELTAILHIQAPYKCMIVGTYVRRIAFKFKFNTQLDIRVPSSGGRP